ncbi:M56 family metallopeptidase [Paenibacillus sp. JDR-2]|uniref:M56 family metallopeptidase n=1 Tax=Paenibacillus sp. (strain JDR-2) TaxID=324057 RepID=UPI0001665070|nr:M56 family metallopeptidase [Paenibacillus sp. JDR-2]ACT02163.1 peptidase M56 BlaR1 [Paenibacillus sp. JDR-2]
MTGVFITVVNMSITAGYVAVAVMLARLLFKRLPKRFSYFLWSAVAFRLLVPVSFTAGFSLLQAVRPQNHSQAGRLEYVPHDIGMQKNPVLDIGVDSLRQLVPLPSATPIASVNPMQIILWLGSLVWLSGIAVLLLYSIVQYLKLWSRLRTATLVQDRIFETDQIRTPFVFGFLKPRIYIPTGLSKEELPYIVAHEQVHINRRDYLIKPAAYLLAIIHWFNPVLWISYRMMGKDMEMSCDERVMKRMGSGVKRSYATTLLSISMNSGKWKMGGPLAFGESDVKARITNVLVYRKPSSWVIALSMLAAVVLVTGFTANPKPLRQSMLPAALDKETYAGYDLDKLMENKTLYVGNHVKVGGLIGALPKPDGLEGKGLALQTKSQPYGITVNYDRTDDLQAEEETAANKDVFYRNAIMLLSLIDNVDSITFTVRNANLVTVTREEAETLLGGDVRQYASDSASLKSLIDQLNKFKWD